MGRFGPCVTKPLTSVLHFLTGKGDLIFTVDFTCLDFAGFLLIFVYFGLFFAKWMFAFIYTGASYCSPYALFTFVLILDKIFNYRTQLPEACSLPFWLKLLKNKDLPVILVKFIVDEYHSKKMHVKHVCIKLRGNMNVKGQES